MPSTDLYGGFAIQAIALGLAKAVGQHNQMPDTKPTEAAMRVNSNCQCIATSNVEGEGPPERRSRGGNRQALLAGGPSRPQC